LRVAAILGPKDTYKTRVAELLISRLSSMGLRVAGVKHLHSSSIDRPGKDTWRMSEAGAAVVVAVGEAVVAVMKRRRGCGLREALKAVGREADVVVVEGFKREAGGMKGVVKVLTARTLEELEELWRLVKPPVAAVTGPVAKQLRSWRGVPVVDLDKEPSKLIELVTRAAELIK